MLGKESTAVKGNFLSAIAMLLAVLVTTLSLEINLLTIMVAILIGASVGSLIALKVKMTAIPEMVALFNGFGGVASFFIAWSQYSEPNINLFQTVIVMLTVYIGGLTFSGSLIAYGKLAEKIKLGKGLSQHDFKVLSYLYFYILDNYGSVNLKDPQKFYEKFAAANGKLLNKTGEYKDIPHTVSGYTVPVMYSKYIGAPGHTGKIKMALQYLIILTKKKIIAQLNLLMKVI